MNALTIRTVRTRADRKAFVDIGFKLNADDPHWVPPLKQEALGLITPEKMAGSAMLARSYSLLNGAARPWAGSARISTHWRWR